MPDIYEKIISLIAANKSVTGGASRMNQDTGVIVRILGESAEQVKEAICLVVNLVRMSSIGAPFSDIRKS